MANNNYLNLLMCISSEEYSGCDEESEFADAFR